LLLVLIIGMGYLLLKCVLKLAAGFPACFFSNDLFLLYEPVSCLPALYFITKQKIKMIQKTYFKTKDYCKVKFSFTPENAETVEVLGLNSDWENAIILKKKKDGTFSTEIALPKDSQHQFKYLVNKTEWVNDTEADEELVNEYGGTNSVIKL
jgi:hypothetical protein